MSLVHKQRRRLQLTEAIVLQPDRTFKGLQISLEIKSVPLNVFTSTENIYSSQKTLVYKQRKRLKLTEVIVLPAQETTAIRSHCFTSRGNYSSEVIVLQAEKMFTADRSHCFTTGENVYSNKKSLVYNQRKRLHKVIVLPA